MANSSYVNILFTALGGIDGSVMPIIWFIAASILTVTFLWGVYDAFVRGGDVRSLGITMLKYAAVALVLLNWAAVFRDLVKSFDYVSNYIYGTNGLGDVVSAWTNGLATAWSDSGDLSMLKLIEGGISALITELGLIIGYIVLPFSLAIFMICFVFWGSILYVLGPLVIATMPSSTLGRFHSRWIENFFVWNCWPLLVNTLWALMTAIHLNNPQGVLGQGDLLGFFQGVEGTILLSLASVIFALLIATIPIDVYKRQPEKLTIGMFDCASEAFKAAYPAIRDAHTKLRRRSLMSWHQQFFDPIKLPNGRKLVTLRDAAKYIVKLSKAEQQATP